ncbi:MAG: chemotaxis protein CheW [Alphaproteobacteria bacterium]
MSEPHASDKDSTGDSMDMTPELVSVMVDDQLFGIPLTAVQEVLKTQRITPIPLARKEIAGNLNLRGRIVTAIDLRQRFALRPRDESENPMNVVVEHDHHLYSLLVDAVDEVVSLPSDRFDRNPPNQAADLREVSAGIIRLDGRLMVVLDVHRLVESQLELA